MENIIVNTCIEMLKTGEVDKIIGFLKRKHRYIELKKAKHDKKLIQQACQLVEQGHNVSHIPLIHELKSIEVVKDIYAIVEINRSKEQKND